MEAFKDTLPIVCNGFKLGCRFHAVLKFYSDRDDIAPLRLRLRDIGVESANI